VSPYHLDEYNVVKILKKLESWKPKFIRGYPSSLYLVSKIAIRHGIELPSLKAALTASEVLSDEYRNTIESAFKIKIFDHYGQAEITTMLHECEAHNGMHILDDYAYTELIDSGSPNQKRLVATNLYNSVMPLIRYDTGDLVIKSEKECDCGRKFPLIKNIIGRSDQLLVHKNGYLLPSINFYTYFSKQKDILRFQIIQKSNENIEVRILLSEKVKKESIISDVKKEMDYRFGTNVDIIENEFQMSIEGKCNPIIQKMKIF
jgi:phenylacetate-CoA ligase